MTMMQATSFTVAGVAVDTRHYIGGSRVGSALTFSNSSPIDGAALGEIARGGPREVDAAVAAARAAFPGWAAAPAAERSAVLHRIADLVEQNIELLAMVETLDNGGLLRSNLR
ncbi:MAG: hypothetical protein QOI70_1445, partial [Microbacteriaceae bacterium]|nr:hypothetical protein [Microbacteriaceae bacterium]